MEYAEQERCRDDENGQKENPPGGGRVGCLCRSSGCWSSMPMRSVSKSSSIALVRSVSSFSTITLQRPAGVMAERYVSEVGGPDP